MNNPWNRAWQRIPGVMLLITILILNAGTIRKQEDPIRMTQTGPISYKAKMEEIKDGIKWAPSPSMVFYGHEGFMVAPPYRKDDDFDVELNYETVVSDEIAQEGNEDLYWWQDSQKADPEPKDKVTW